MAEIPTIKKEIRITPQKGWFDFDWKELWIARELVYRFVHRDFISSYKQTILGPLWFIVPPIITTVVFTFIFGRIGGIDTGNAPDFLFFMSGVILWNYFSTCLLRTSNTFAGSSGLFGKVYFPRLTVPISILISNLITLGIQVLIFFAIYAFYWLKYGTVHPNSWLLTLPLLIIQLAVLGLGVGSLVSALTTYYRDFAMIVSFGVQLWMYASGVVVPLSGIQGKWAFLLMLNPVAPIIESWRYACFGTNPVDPLYLWISAATTVIISAVGLLIFRRMENTFMDTV